MDNVAVIPVLSMRLGFEQISCQQKKYRASEKKGK
jgi:hypothetical protein